MSWSATSTFILNTSRDGDSAASLASLWRTYTSHWHQGNLGLTEGSRIASGCAAWGQSLALAP